MGEIECDEIVDIDHLDTVIIFRDNNITMEDIMTRDQRTTSHRVLDRCQHGNGHFLTKFNNRLNSRNDKFRNDDQSFSSCDTCNFKCYCRKHFRRHNYQEFCCNNNNQRTYKYSTVIRKKTTTTWLRLGSLLVTLFAISVQGAPTKMAYQDRRLSASPKWVNPCGLVADDINSDEFSQISDAQLLAQVVLQARNALGHAQLFREDYVKRTFNSDFRDLHAMWKDSHYDWLPGPNEIPKQLLEPLPQEYLGKLEVRMLDEILLNTYEYMQRFAVGLEQIVWDHDDQGLEFRHQFKDTEFQLRTVLCELQEALVERGVPLRADITRNAMSSEYRAMSKMETYRNLRDWLIFRDYMNGLEYIVQVFQHLLDKLNS